METLLVRWKRWWKRTPRAIRQAIVAVVGCTVLLAGVVMLVTPGPGWAALFLGFAILATEFAFAERVRDRTVELLKRLIEWGKHWWFKLVRPKKKRKSR